MAYTTIDDPTLHFRVKAYTGNGTNDTAYTWDETHANMQPDWLWFKNRDENQSHAVFDSVRGATLRLVANETGAEGTENTNLDSFDSNGFTVDNELIVNGSSDKMVVWGWKAGGSASSNSDGSVTTSVSANTTAGFSIVSYTGTGSVGTFGHGLGAKPNVMIQKKRSGSAAWTVYHDKVASDPATDYLYLNSSAAADDYADHFNDTEPTSSLFTLGTDTSVNGSSATNIMYCFAEKKGYSKFGSYQGNGNANGTFVYTGFRPAWLMVKRTSGSYNWGMFDNKRNTSNLTNLFLAADGSEAEITTTSYPFDFYSNGFKVRGTGGGGNADGETYLFFVFAEAPFTNSSGVPCNAR
jgi:hypothetical protein